MVIWKNIDFKTKGIVVEKIYVPDKAKKNIETYEIDGRSGFLSIDKGTYKPFSASIECHAKETNDFDDIKTFLDGYGTLSFDNDREYTAIINNAIPFDKVANFRKFVVQFLVNPIAHDINATTENITSASTTFEITGATAEMTPNIEIQGDGEVQITINNKTFTLDMDSTKTYTLDSENKMIIDNLGANSSNIMNGDFPVLKNGTNNVDYLGTVTEFTISYKKAYL